MTTDNRTIPADVDDSAQAIMDDYQLAVSLYWKDRKAELVEAHAVCVQRIKDLIEERVREALARASWKR